MKVNRKIILFVLLWLFVLFYPIDAAFLTLPTSAGIAGNSGLVSGQSSPAAIWLSATPIDITHGLSTSHFHPFSFSMLSYYSCTGTYTISPIIFSAGYNYLDAIHYHEHSFLFNIATKITAQSTIGNSIIIHKKTAKYCTEESAVQWDIGLETTIKKFHILFTIKNLLGAELANDPLPQEGRYEMRYPVTRAIHAVLGITKQQQFPFSPHIAIHYQPYPLITFLSGYQGNANRFSAGVIFTIHKINIEYAVVSHEYLQKTHHLSIHYSIKK